MSYRAYLSEADSRHLERTVARAEVFRPEEVASAIEFARQSEAKLLILRCPVNEGLALRALWEVRAFLADTLIQYTLKLNRLPPNRMVTTLPVRPFRSGEEAELGDLAARAFRDSSTHYHADPRIEREQCGQVYRGWLLDACRGRGPKQEVFVAEQAGRPIGFGVASIRPSGEVEAMLAGVSPDSEVPRLFVYRALLLAGTRFALDNGVRRAVTSTQIGNLAIQRLWVRLGWEPAAAFHTFHYWLE